MVFSDVIVDVTIPRRSFVFGQSRANVSAGFTNLRSLAVAAIDDCLTVTIDGSKRTNY